MNTTSPVRRVQRVRHDLKRRELRVARVEPLGPHFVAVTLAGDGLADFASDGFDDHVKLIFAGDGSAEAVRRDYTPRRFDRARRELTIEFDLHGRGPAASWARHAAVGQTLVVGGPRGSMVVPVDYDWHLLAGDGSALPAVRRRLEELPAGARAIVLLEVPDQADRVPLESAADVELHWVASPDAWLAALRAQALPEGEGYAWCAGEASVMAEARRVLVDEKGHPKEAMRVAAYWKHGKADHHEELGGD